MVKNKSTKLAVGDGQKYVLKVCPDCGTKIVGKQALAQHMLSKHPRIITQGPSKPTLNLVKNVPKRNASVKVMPGHNYVTALKQQLGRTGSGRAWALAALHPCGAGEIIGDSAKSVVGLPDTMTSSVVTPHYRSESNIAFDSTMFTDTIPSPPVGTWGIDVVIPPIPEIDYVYRLRYDNAGFVSNWRVVRTPNFNIPALPHGDATVGVTFASAGYGKARMIGNGHTFELDCTDLSNQGRIVVGQLDGQWYTENFAASNFTGIADEAVKFADPPDPTVGIPVWRRDITRPWIFGDATTMHTQLLSVPTDPQAITASCPYAYQGLARDGAYIVSKFASPLLGYQFQSTGGYKAFVNDTQEATADSQYNNSLPGSAFAISGNVTDPVKQLQDYDLFTNDSAWDPALKLGLAGAGVGAEGVNGRVVSPFVSTHSEMLVACMTVRNLVFSTNVPSLRVKTRQYYECISSAANPATLPFTHPPADYDYPALESVITIGKQMADAYPACYNEDGGILHPIMTGLKSLVDPLIGTVSNAHIPIISDVAGMLGNIL